MAARDVVALNESVPRLEVAQSGDTYNFPRAVAMAGALSVTGVITPTGGFALSLIPNADDTYNLGSASFEWSNLYVDGTANIDSLVADTADINAGTIDGVTIGGTTPGDGDFATLGVVGAAILADAVLIGGVLTMADDIDLDGNDLLNAVIDGGTF
jgi:hypothetical protein